MNTVPSGAQFDIVASPHRATLVEVGGGIRTLTCEGHPVLDGYPRHDRPGGRCTRLWADEHYRFIELYTRDTQPPNKQHRGLGIEPMTCAPNDFHDGNNLIILDPGQSITSRWGLYPD